VRTNANAFDHVTFLETPFVEEQTPKWNEKNQVQYHTTEYIKDTIFR
jgi:uncharacterized phage-like protein YoqJ